MQTILKKKSAYRSAHSSVFTAKKTSSNGDKMLLARARLLALQQWTMQRESLLVFLEIVTVNDLPSHRWYHNKRETFHHRQKFAFCPARFISTIDRNTIVISQKDGLWGRYQCRVYFHGWMVHNLVRCFAQWYFLHDPVHVIRDRIRW